MFHAGVCAQASVANPVISIANRLCASADDAGDRLLCRRDCGAAHNLWHRSSSAVLGRRQVQCEPTSHHSLCDGCWLPRVLGNLPSHPTPDPLEQQGSGCQSPEEDEFARPGETQNAASMICHTYTMPALCACMWFTFTHLHATVYGCFPPVPPSASDGHASLYAVHDMRRGKYAVCIPRVSHCHACSAVVAGWQFQVFARHQTMH